MIGKEKYLVCLLVSRDLCIGLRENEMERDGKNFFSKGICYFINWWGYLVKFYSRFGKELKLGDWYI